MLHDPLYPSSEVLSSEQYADIARFNARIAANEIAFEEVPCLCGSNAFEVIATYDRYRIWQPVVICVNCGLIQCRPRMAPQTLDWFYSSDLYRHIYKPKSISTPLTQEIFEQISATTRPRDAIRAIVPNYHCITRVGEIGCGGGWNLEKFRRDGKTVAGCDPSPILTEAGRRFGLDLRTGSQETLAGLSFDLLIFSHVVEHFSYPLAAVKAALDLLTPTGYVYIEVPDMREVCLGALQGAHLYYFTPTTLIHFMARIGLTPVAPATTIGRAHFSVVFQRHPSPPIVDFSGEYPLMKRLIGRFERREKLKDWLRRARMLDLVRQLYRRIKNFN